MAAREFHGVISNQWESPLFRSADDCDSGEWQDPWYPSKVPGAGEIGPQGEGEWRSESDGVATGTSGWARWGVRVFDVFDGDHFEFVQVNWAVPFLQTDYPNITCAVFRNNPAEADAFAVSDPKPPLLEIVPAVKGADGTVRALSQDGDAPPLAKLGQIAPYVFTIPASFFATSLFGPVTHPRVEFIVRRKAGNQAQSSLTFPNMLPSPQQMAMQGFRHRMEMAAAAGFTGGFPNFYEATHGRDHVGGTIFVKQATAEWREVALAELGNVALENFEERMRATNTWATQQNSAPNQSLDRARAAVSQDHFIGGFPTFFDANHGGGVVCGTILVRSDGAEFRDVPLSELGNPALNDFAARFRATQDYASRNGFVGGFPTLHDSRAVVNVDVRTGQKQYATVCGTVLLKQGELEVHAEQSGGIFRAPTYAERRDVLLFQDPA